MDACIQCMGKVMSHFDWDEANQQAELRDMYIIRIHQCYVHVNVLDEGFASL